jgi:hypothetical protein
MDQPTNQPMNQWTLTFGGPVGGPAAAGAAATEPPGQWADPPTNSTEWALAAIRRLADLRRPVTPPRTGRPRLSASAASSGPRPPTAPPDRAAIVARIAQLQAMLASSAEEGVDDGEEDVDSGVEDHTARYETETSPEEQQQQPASSSSQPPAGRTANSRTTHSRACRTNKPAQPPARKAMRAMESAMKPKDKK